jgi:hypothetical protein
MPCESLGRDLPSRIPRRLPIESVPAVDSRAGSGSIRRTSTGARYWPYELQGLPPPEIRAASDLIGASSAVAKAVSEGEISRHDSSAISTDLGRQAGRFTRALPRRGRRGGVRGSSHSRAFIKFGSRWFEASTGDRTLPTSRRAPRGALSREASRGRSSRLERRANLLESQVVASVGG